MVKVRFYHGTTKNKLDSIIKYGLRPRCCSETEAKLRNLVRNDHIPTPVRKQLDMRCDLKVGVDPIYLTTSKRSAKGYADFISKGLPMGYDRVGIRGQGEACSMFMDDIETAKYYCNGDYEEDCEDMRLWYERSKMFFDDCKVAENGADTPIVLQLDVDLDDAFLVDDGLRWTIEKYNIEDRNCAIKDDTIICDDSRLETISGSRYYGIIPPDKIKVVK